MDCLEQGSRGSILQFMPFTMVSPILLPGCRVLWSAGPMGQTGTSRGVPLPGSRGSSTVVSQLCLSSLRTGFGAGESVHHVQSQNCPGHHGSQPAPGPPRCCQGHRCAVSGASPFCRAGEGCRAAAGKSMRTWMLGWDWDAWDSLSVAAGSAWPCPGAASLCVRPPRGIPLLPRDGLTETETNPLLFFYN